MKLIRTVDAEGAVLRNKLTGIHGFAVYLPSDTGLG